MDFGILTPELQGSAIRSCESVNSHTGHNSKGCPWPKSPRAEQQRHCPLPLSCQPRQLQSIQRKDWAWASASMTLQENPRTLLWALEAMGSNLMTASGTTIPISEMKKGTHQRDKTETTLSKVIET